MAPQDRPAQIWAASPPAEDAPYYRQVAHELTDMGVELAGIIKSTIAGPLSDDDRVSKITTAFEHLSRAVRCGILLENRLRRLFPACGTSSESAGRSRILVGIDDAIGRMTGPSDWRRPEHPAPEEETYNPEDEIGDQPAADILAGICRDLGIAAAMLPGLPLWKRRTPVDIIRLCGLAAARSVKPVS